MAYVRYYTTWKDWPNVSTPAVAAAFQNIEDGLTTAATNADGATSTANSAATTATAAQTAAAAAQTTANAAIPKSTVTTAGDLIYATGNAAVTRLGIGAAGTVLKGGVSAPSFASIVDADISAAAAIGIAKLNGYPTDGTKFLAGDATWKAVGASGLVVLADLTLGASQATIDTNTILGGNLPQTSSHLKVVIVSREDTATTLDTILMRINNDSTANYDWEYLRGAGASASAAEGLGQTSLTVGLEPGSSVSAGVFSATEILIPQYTGTVANKTITCASNGKIGTATGNIFHQTSSGFWRSSAAITRLTFLPAAGNFIAGTRITVYGLV